jgi:hypothetical protein
MDPLGEALLNWGFLRRPGAPRSRPSARDRPVAAQQRRSDLRDLRW